MKLRQIFAILLFLSATSCNRNTNFSYLRPLKVVEEKTIPIKELLGPNKVDILWVIDNSGSMSDHQKNVILNMNNFINGLTGGSTLDWKAGLISTSEGEPPHGGLEKGTEWISTDPDVGHKMKKAIGQLGLGGDPTEKTFEPVLKALQDYPSFLRPGGAFAIIVISDAPEQSRITANEFVQKLTTLKGGLESTYFYGFLNPEDWCQPTDDRWDWARSPFEDVNKLLRGNIYKLCDPNFASNLTDLGKNISEMVSKSRIYLKNFPRPETIKVNYKGKSLPYGLKAEGGLWIYRADFNAIEFHDLNFAPGNNESVDIYYEIDDGTVERKG